MVKKKKRVKKSTLKKFKSNKEEKNLSTFPLLIGAVIWGVIVFGAIEPALQDALWSQSDFFVFNIGLGIFFAGLGIGYIIYLKGISMGSDDENIEAQNSRMIETITLSILCLGGLYLVSILFS